MRELVLTLVVLVAVLLTGCARERQTIGTEELMPEETFVQEPNPAKDEGPMLMTGQYDSKHLSLSYSLDTLELHETAIRDDEETFLLTLTERGSGDGAFPRLDILSVKTAGFTDALASKIDGSEVGSEFNAFAAAILCAYYVQDIESEAEDTPQIEMGEAQTETGSTDAVCRTEGHIGAWDGFPAMVASVEMRCFGENGVIIIMLAPEGVSDPIIGELMAARETIQHRQ